MQCIQESCTTRLHNITDVSFADTDSDSGRDRSICEICIFGELLASPVCMHLSFPLHLTTAFARCHVADVPVLSAQIIVGRSRLLPACFVRCVSVSFWFWFSVALSLSLSAMFACDKQANKFHLQLYHTNTSLASLSSVWNTRIPNTCTHLYTKYTCLFIVVKHIHCISQ